MADAVQRKQEADLTKDCDETIPIAETLAKDGKVQEALDKLLILEKQTRNAADLSSTTRVLLAFTSILHSLQDWPLLNTYILLLSKKHGQMRQATQKMVDDVMEYFKELEVEGKEKERLALIDTLRDVTEGKIYLEVPRARVTRMLSTLKEKEGKLTEASELLQDLQVETFGSMERDEKVDFILEQMRLLKEMGDWEKLQIVSKRVNVKWLEGHEELKLRFYNLMILFALHSSRYLEVCKYYRQIYDTPSIKDDESKWFSVLRNIVYFVVLAPYDNEQSDLLRRVELDGNLTKIPEAYNLIQCFTTPELMRWPGIEAMYGSSLRQTKVFGPAGVKGVEGDVEEDISLGDKRWEVLHDRVVEHNIRTISTYYVRITLPRLSSLLDLPTSQTELFLSKLVTSKTVYAKIDRPAGLVSFKAPKKGDEVLNEWSSDVGKLMGLVEKSCHLIAKEHAINAALKAQQGLKA